MAHSDTTEHGLESLIVNHLIEEKGVGATIGVVREGEGSKTQQLKKYLAEGKRIIILTVQTFPFALDVIGTEHRGKKFAIIIDEAHSSQGSKTSAAMNVALSEGGAEQEDETTEDKINRIMEARKLLPNARYSAFTATPKNKTLEIFGQPYQDGGETKHRPFHCYTVKQATQEGFILDVLKHYTPVASYYKLVKAIEDDPEYDTKRAKKKLRKYVESNDHAIRLKAEIMVDHFHEQVIGLQKIGGQARAMVVTSGIERAIQYYHAMCDYLKERKSPYKAIVAFSGEHEYGGAKVTEASLNGFPSSQIADSIQEDPYRFLICADKFQTGYDEPLLHTMYVDKPLSSIKADLDGCQVYGPEHVDELVELYLDGADRDRLDPILDACVATYNEQLDEDGQVDFKGKAKAFCRAYDFLASILPYTDAGWERLSIFLNFLVPKLSAPKEEDLSKGILESIDMDSYRVEKQAVMQIQLPDRVAEIGPVPTQGGGYKPEPELDRLSNILRAFNDQFGNVPWSDADRVHKLITEDIPAKVAADTAYQNANKQGDKSKARIEHDAALLRVMVELLKDDTELFKQYSDNEGFKRWLADTVFGLTFEENAA